jgi:xylulose-5-phosphate/fructose-6-phosphate phosphoketolase
MDAMLSEHICEGMLEGYILTGRHGFFASYEAFARVIDSMLTQMQKWIKQIKTMEWRSPLPSLNLIATSHTWQQDHNGFTHQDPGLGAHLLDKDISAIKCYYPADANTLLCVFDKCMRDTNKINLITASKHPTLQWRTGIQAAADAAAGISVWDDAENPDVVLASCGDTPTLECVMSMKIIKEKFPELKVRFVNVIDLGKLGTLTDKEYEKIFTNNKPVVFIHHGYVNIIKALSAFRPNANLWTVAGYREEGAITTDFDMRVLNGIDRFHIVQYITGENTEMQDKLKKHKQYIAEYGINPTWLD